MRDPSRPHHPDSYPYVINSHVDVEGVGEDLTVEMWFVIEEGARLAGGVLTWQDDDRIKRAMVRVTDPSPPSVVLVGEYESWTIWAPDDDHPRLRMTLGERLEIDLRLPELPEPDPLPWQRKWLLGWNTDSVIVAPDPDPDSEITAPMYADLAALLAGNDEPTNTNYARHPVSEHVWPPTRRRW